MEKTAHIGIDGEVKVTGLADFGTVLFLLLSIPRREIWINIPSASRYLGNRRRRAI